MEIVGLKEAYESMANRASFDYETFLLIVDKFEVVPCYVDGKCCGALLILENHIHPCILPWSKGRWLSKKNIRILNNLVIKYGEATTIVSTQEGKEFAEQLGFVKDGEIYRMVKLWAGKN